MRNCANQTCACHAAGLRLYFGSRLYQLGIGGRFYVETTGPQHMVPLPANIKHLDTALRRMDQIIKEERRHAP